MRNLRRFVHEQTPFKIWTVAVCLAMFLGRLTAVEPYDFNQFVMACIVVPATIGLPIIYYSPKDPADANEY